MKLNECAVFMLLSWIPMEVFGEGISWLLDPADSEFGYQVNWEDIPFWTRFTRFSGELKTNQDKQPEQLKIRIRLSGLDSENEERDEGMQLPEWFWRARYPLAVYHSDSIERLQSGRYRAHGSLQLRGVSKTVSVVFGWQLPDADSAASVAIMKGEVVIPRLNFGIGLGEWSTDEYVGLDVLVRFNLNWVASP